ncbi:xylose isomerase [Cohnella sp. CIP 111063]|uniref:sugar phosphate isomerase/epimerase family protein n=1 Tax=unclassified Cohnella TaxID=2636738 RepID=UPI000B8C0042|nr:MULTISPECIES: sugar phosphate isomerase/epimerase family protein [unclassified Cohnella]OXS59179.1 xylose isomerase [Cohnella sp. CIP 111063]PRX72187.1 sugar phosphate isomerase/epimerase [Cohnella sp. SGD-V74]
MSYLSVSTWSLHRLLGPLRWTSWDAENGEHRTHEQPQPQVHSLLELPGEAARRGYAAVEVCHFHFPSVEVSYLAQLPQAFAEAGVSFDTLLLDYGDPSATDEIRQAADVKLFREWIDVASQCGAKRIRIVAGEAQPTDEQAILRSAQALRELAEYASARGVRVVTENFKALTSTGESSVKLLNSAGDGVGMITDFGNYKGETKYSEIAMTAPRSSSVHVKPAYDENGIPDEAELIRCLEAVRGTGYDGAFVLIYDGPGDMWEGLERVKRIVAPYV